eukprot:GDKI01016183.1.p1 GENE.GDKI01016183.1~~GDKI01016183.1.p1  ORF type:complete len:390 (-),score=174.75 GDKI01016183.1:461-1630(-)
MKLAVLLAVFGVHAAAAKESFRGSLKAASWDDEVPYEDPKTAKWKDMWLDIQHTEGLRAFEELIQVANVRGDLLANSDKKLTLLIPSDSAMKKAFGKAGLKDLARRPKSVKKLFAYHTLEGECYLTERMLAEEHKEVFHTGLSKDAEVAKAGTGDLTFSMEFNDKQVMSLNVKNTKDATLAHITTRSDKGQQLYDIKSTYGCFHVIDQVLELPEEARAKSFLDRLMDMYRRWMHGGDARTNFNTNHDNDDDDEGDGDDEPVSPKSPTTDPDFYEDVDDVKGDENQAAPDEKKDDIPATNGEEKPASDEGDKKDDKDEKKDEEPAKENDNTNTNTNDDKPSEPEGNDDKPERGEEKRDDNKPSGDDNINNTNNTNDDDDDAPPSPPEWMQ